MNTRTKNLAMVGGAVAAVGFVAVNTLMPAEPVPAADAVVAPAEPGAVTPGAPVVPAIPGTTPGAAASASPDDAGSGARIAPGAAPASPAGVAGAAPAGRRSYAVGLHDLSGFPPDAAPGSRLELWVTWEPPLTEEPRLQKLAGDVVLERTIPGSVPEAPVTILLSVPAGKVSDLIYADTFGKLSVAVPE